MLKKLVSREEGEKKKKRKRKNYCVKKECQTRKAESGMGSCAGVMILE